MSEPTYEELKARLAELEKQGQRRSGTLEFRVGEKGGVSVYGLGRFPVTLYYEQWIRLLDAGKESLIFKPHPANALARYPHLLRPAVRRWSWPSRPVLQKMY